MPCMVSVEAFILVVYTVLARLKLLIHIWFWNISGKDLLLPPSVALLEVFLEYYINLIRLGSRCLQRIVLGE